jgi:hypothetical protein
MIGAILAVVAVHHAERRLLGRRSLTGYDS